MPMIECYRCGIVPCEHTYWVICAGSSVRACKKCHEEWRFDMGIRKNLPELFRPAEISELGSVLRRKITSLPKDKGLLLWGNAGVGKSYAMAAIIKDMLMKNPDCDIKRIGFEMICLKIRDTYKQNSNSTELDVINPLMAIDVLFVEDVGTTVSVGESESDFSLRTFLVLLDSRLENCKRTFITTNKSIEELAKSFDSRIASRLQQLCEVIHLTGKDKREAKKCKLT